MAHICYSLALTPFSLFRSSSSSGLRNSDAGESSSAATVAAAAPTTPFAAIAPAAAPNVPSSLSSSPTAANTSPSAAAAGAGGAAGAAAGYEMISLAADYFCACSLNMFQESYITFLYVVYFAACVVMDCMPNG